MPRVWAVVLVVAAAVTAVAAAVTAVAAAVTAVVAAAVVDVAAVHEVYWAIQSLPMVSALPSQSHPHSSDRARPN